jgi:hypothetical protein
VLYAENSKVSNGDFESVDKGCFPGWTVSGKAAPVALSGVWQRLTCTFRSGSYKEAIFFFWVARGSTGSVWLDNLVVGPDVQFKNPGLEDVDADGGLSGWQQDNRGVTVFSAADRVSEGRRSVRITHAHEAVPLTRIWQTFAVEPDHEYTLSFELFVGDDFQGDAKGWMFDPTASHSLDFDTESLQVSNLVANRDRCGGYAAALTPSGTAPVVLAQEIGVRKGMNLRASVDINNKEFQGTARMVVEDVSSGRILGELSAKEVSATWRSLLVSFQSTSAKLRVRVVAEGRGALQVDNVAVTPPTVIPPLQRVKWLPAAENFVIPVLLTVSVQGQEGPAIEGGLSLLRNDLKTLGVGVEKVDSDKAALRILIGKKHALKGKGKEAYSVTIDHAGIEIRAGHEAGAFYGLMTVLQLLERQPAGAVVLAGKVVDYPDLPLRGILYGDAEQAARWKMNAVMVSTGYPVTPAEKQGLHEVLKTCQSLNLEVIPYFLSMAGGYYVQKINPNLAAGIWVQDEKVVLQGTQPSALANPYVIRTGLSEVQVKSQDGKETYALGKDYQVVDGEMGYNYTNPKAAPFAVARLPGSAIPDGGTVLVSYDYVSHYRAADNRTETHLPYCPLEPETRRLMDEFLRDFAREFPVPYINTSNDLHEFGPAAVRLATDSRVIGSGKKPIELYAADVCSQAAAVRQGNPTTRILQWTGDVGDYAKAAGPLLPREALMNIWGYDANWPTTYGRDAVEYWTRLGFETSVMPWDNLRNVRGWAQVVAEARRRGYPCIGMIGSIWDKRDGGFRETASVSWKVPKPGETGFVALPRRGTVRP